MCQPVRCFGTLVFQPRKVALCRVMQSVYLWQKFCMLDSGLMGSFLKGALQFFWSHFHWTEQELFSFSCQCLLLDVCDCNLKQGEGDVCYERNSGRCVCNLCHLGSKTVEGVSVLLQER